MQEAFKPRMYSDRGQMCVSADKLICRWIRRSGSGHRGMASLHTPPELGRLVKEARLSSHEMFIAAVRIAATAGPPSSSSDVVWLKGENADQISH